MLSERDTLMQQEEKQDAEPVVVFVCEHGSAKSVVAAAYFNQLAREHRPFSNQFVFCQRRL